MSGSEINEGSVLAGRFELLRRLGSGGLAEVYAARDRESSAEVAVKLLHAHLAEEPEVAERFRRELTVTRALNHPGIVKVYDLHEEAGRPFFTMELLRGETLAERLERGEKMPPEEARRIAREVCAALLVAHRQGVVHRDLKPANLFLCDSGLVKIVDFGLARVAGWARLTAQSTVMGTPGYLAPELLAGTGADARADLYAVGATLFEMLTGRRAFPGSDPLQVLRSQNAGPPSPRAVAPAVSEGDDALVRRALDPDPERRFQGAAQLLRELGGEVAPLPLNVPPSMTAGNLDVVMHGNLFERRALERVFAALGVVPKPGWKVRLRLMGKNALAEGTSRGTAEALASLCQEQGVGTALEPHRTRGKVRRWLAAQAPKIALLSGGGAFAAGVALALLGVWGGEPGGLNAALNGAGSAGLPLGTMAVAGVGWGTLLFSFTWALLGAGSEAPLQNLPEGDPAVRRLMDGIARRVIKLREKREAASPAAQLLLTDLIDAGERLREAAAELANAAAVIDDPLSNSGAHWLEPGSAEAVAARDAALAQLLEMAASLDEALAVQPELPSTTRLISRLREETEFARKVLPELAAVRRGEELPPALAQGPEAAEPAMPAQAARAAPRPAVSSAE